MDKYQLYQYNYAQQESVDNKKKADEFLERVNQFKDISSLKDAKELSEKILPVSKELTSFYVGDIKCTVLNKTDNFRISIMTNSDYFCYDFV